MNISRAISQLKMQLGLQNITLPFKNENDEPLPAENIIQNILSTVTIPIYSQFVPWIREGDCNLNSLKIVDKHRGIYMLPAFLTLTNVMYVSDVYMPLHNSRGTYGDIAPAYGINRSAQGVINSQSYMMLAGQMRAEPTFEYLGENKIRLYGFPKTVLTFKVACEHEPNGETIPESCYDSFMELAELDVKVFLYNNLKHYKNIPSAHGNINLEIDEYQSATSDRNSLLNDWRDRFHLDMQWEEFM